MSEYRRGQMLPSLRGERIYLRPLTLEDATEGPWYTWFNDPEATRYTQHRGGHKGFLKVLDERTLAFADFAGNKQYISVGNLDENDKAYLFLMDYPNRRRVKIWGTAEIVENDDDLLRELVDPEYRGKPERAVLFHVGAWDVNCPQHITPRRTDEDIAPLVEDLEARVDELQSENQRLRRRLDQFSGARQSAANIGR